MLRLPSDCERTVDVAAMNGQAIQMGVAEPFFWREYNQLAAGRGPRALPDEITSEPTQDRLDGVRLTMVHRRARAKIEKTPIRASITGMFNARYVI